MTEISISQLTPVCGIRCLNQGCAVCVAVHRPRDANLYLAAAAHPAHSKQPWMQQQVALQADSGASSISQPSSSQSEDAAAAALTEAAAAAAAECTSPRTLSKQPRLVSCRVYEVRRPWLEFSATTSYVLGYCHLTAAVLACCLHKAPAALTGMEPRSDALAPPGCWQPSSCTGIWPASTAVLRLLA